MRTPLKLMSIFTMVLGLIFAFSVDSRAIGPKGNRVTGSVDDKDTIKPLKGVRVSFYKRKKPYDVTDPNGVFYLIIPKDVRTFRLVFAKDGYGSKMSERDYDSDDPVKHTRIQLEKPNPNMNQQEFKFFIQNELNVQSFASPEFKAIIRHNLWNLSTQKWVMEDNFKGGIICDAQKKMEWF